ncbi:MAG: 1-deoxy-D-xylulose-5-phosphate synthase, partial [Deltaproteobacteria bacterium]|nr:1-deoxy-D-xylulose-5-phosphate synthase [Deltaproteobacteria bacterium]
MGKGACPGTKILDGITGPDDIKCLSIEELKDLAKEIRQEIIAVVSRNGGHLAPNLGVVELTLALHYVFDTPKDKIIFDVGHQCYTHKLITGRRKAFSTIRTYGGISGFPKREESPYDPFDTGHSSTSISAALGVATANCLKRAKSKVIAVIGDGSMTGGLAFEGLNQAGHLDKDLIVVLNDNEMSISPNVGAMSSFLSRKLTQKVVINLKREMENFLKTIRGGDNIIQILKRSEDSLKGLFTPGMLFQALKFDYIGPIKGHDLGLLIETFEIAKHVGSPVLIQVMTTKGKGYAPAEKDPTYFHGVGAFDIETGKPPAAKTEVPSYTEVFGRTLVELAEKDNKIFAITAAMPEGTGLQGFRKNFKDRFMDVGIAEQHAVTFAAGLAAEGFKPVVAVYSTFMQRAYDQVIHDVCLQNLPVVFAMDRAGIVGEDGPTHHGVFDLSFMRAVPRMVVMAPKDENELRHMLKTAVEHPGPISLRYPRGAGVGVPLTDELQVLPIGRAEKLTDGNDLLILAIGAMVQEAMDAATLLQQEGISATVINARFVNPLDEEMILPLADKIKNVITVEENVLK